MIRKCLDEDWAWRDHFEPAGPQRSNPRLVKAVTEL